jgi:heme-binding NEAT domain protein
MFYKKSLKRYLSILIASILLLSAFPISAAAAEPAPATKVRDGEYEVDFRILQNNSDKESYAEGHLKSTKGKLIAEDGVYKLQIDFINYDWYEYWGSLKPGGTPSANADAVSQFNQAAEVDVSDGTVPRGPLNENTLVEGYYGTVEFPIDDVQVKQDVLMHIVVKDLYVQGQPFVYDHWYLAQVVIDTSNLPFVSVEEPPVTEEPDVSLDDLSWQITLAQSLYNSTQDGAWHGAYKPGARTSLNYAISDAIEVESDMAATDEEIVTAYNALVQALNVFRQQRVTVNKSLLLTAIQEAEAFAANLSYVTNAGVYVEGSIAGLTSTTMGTPITNAKAVYDNALATQDQVNASVTSLSTATTAINNARIIATDARLIVLDSLDSDAVESTKSSLFGSTATILKRSTPREHANIIINDNIPLTSITYYRPSTDGTPTFVMDLPVTMASTGLDAGTGQYSAQLQQRHTTFNNQSISGIVFMNYSTADEPSVTESVYLSLNGTLLDHLNGEIADAQELHDRALNGELSGQYDIDALSTLQAAIDTAIVTGSQLSATRLDISAASAALSEVVTTFLSLERSTLNYTIAHATDSAFSSADSYFEKPARVTQISGTTYDATIKILNSSQVTEFQYKQSEGEYVDADVLYENAAEDYRIVLLNGIDISQLQNAKLHVSIPAANYDRTHEVRLNFNGVNNSLLSSEFLEAMSTWRGAKAGTAIGEYPASAISTFKTAIDTAGGAATQLNGTQIQTDAALIVLRMAVAAFEASVNLTGTEPGTDPGPGTPGNGTDPQYPANGSYYIPFTVLKYGTESLSVANDYFVSPALVKVTGGNKTVSFTVVQSAEITGLKIGGNSGSVTSRDAANNTRVVTFNLSNLASKLSAWVKIDWSALNYHHEYDIHFKFDEAQATYAGDSGVIGGGTVGPPALPNPDEETEGQEGEEGEVTNPNGENGQEETNPESNESPNIQFSDTANHWAKPVIERAVKLGIVSGFSDGSFRPNNIVTRGEFAVMISKALGLEGEGEEGALKDLDSIPNWAKTHVARVITAGLIAGFEDSTFRSKGQLTRAQLAVIISRAAGLKLDPSATLSFVDGDDVPAWAQQEVSAAVGAGLITGKDGNRFDPNAAATRAEALALIIRLLDYLD